MSDHEGLTDLGFLCLRTARRSVRRLGLRVQLRQIEALCATALHALDQPRDALSNAPAPVVQRGVELTDGDIESGVGGEAIDDVERQNVREQELLEGAGLVFQLLNALLHAVGQGCFSAVDCSPEAIAVRIESHRLSTCTGWTAAT